MKTRNYTKTLGWIYLVSIIVSSCSKIDPESQNPTEAFQKVLDHQIVLHDGKGVSAAIIADNKELWSGTSGYSYGSAVVSNNTVFCIGSVTKTYIAALCLELAEEGVLSLKDPIHHWLPDYPNIDHSITVEQLLMNTSGIYNVSDNTILWDSVFYYPERIWEPETILQTFQLEPYASPGEGWYYSNTNYILLGLIINESTGSSVSHGLRNYFFDPLGLSDTYFCLEEEMPVEIAHGWFDLSSDGGYEDVSLISRNGIYSVLWTSAALFSTAEDLAKWGYLLFSGNAISNSSLDQLMNNRCAMPGTTDVECGMGLFFIGPSNSTGAELIGYTGRTFGYLASMFYVPDFNLSVAVIINEDNAELLDAITTDLILEAVKLSENQ